MPELIEMHLDEGGSVWVEVSDGLPVIDRVGRGEDALRSTARTLQDALSRVRPAVDAVVDQLRSAALPPDEVNVQFGIKITAEAGAVIAKAATEANFTVSATWVSERSMGRGASSAGAANAADEEAPLAAPPSPRGAQNP
ncbi:CU044_2847 family protein [Streptomyces sp. NBC_01551]|uniref:CU044_2847 family protein n=1 Tax=Streptomyces sp. NBC_01551 TaxID=2975876 RepID=UPI0022564112|nr:CU044_2847 family protein [Streptomyces sp. NBC_01551]MCX4529865.1 CU044_2847 family protein [Streptomyces sp. NBC_01551]